MNAEEAWILEWSPAQRALHLRPAAEGSGPGDWRILEKGSQELVEALALICDPFLGLPWFAGGFHPTWTDPLAVGTGWAFHKPQEWA